MQAITVQALTTHGRVDACGVARTIKDARSVLRTAELFKVQPVRVELVAAFGMVAVEEVPTYRWIASMCW